MRTPHSNRFGFRLVRALVVVGAAGAAMIPSGDARAQSAGTTNRPIPNLLLLVDTSGSMERMPDNTLPSANPANACNPGSSSNPNRWGMLLQALTGNLQPGYSCYALSRASAAPSPFVSEFQINSIKPYDADYALPYHRPVAGTGASACVLAPYQLPGAASGSGVGPSKLGAGGLASDFPANAVVSVTYSHLTGTYAGGGTISPGANACTFQQATDGQLDLAQDFVRFGLMTFDNDPSEKIGVTPARPTLPPWSPLVDTTDPFTGQWSWLRTCPGDNATPTPPSGCFTRTNTPPLLPASIPAGVAGGRPTIAGCSGVTCCAYKPMEVGARHFAAPPWEGRMVLFPDPVGTLTDIERTNGQIQNVLLATRPFGATPIDGMLDDARDYLWYSSFGPYSSDPAYNDPYVQGGCRDQYIILLTDGAPNLDMRGFGQAGTSGCTGADCPYDLGSSIADKLYHYNTSDPTKRKVRTFVIGFSVNGTSTTVPNNGFPSTLPPASMTCKGWYADTSAVGGNGSPTTMDSMCGAQLAPCAPAFASSGWVASSGGFCVPPKGSTADACCELNKIAYNGSGGATPTGGDVSIGAYFADSQTDIVTAFSSILGSISKSATTRTIPASSPGITVSGLATPIAATFVASFVPDARKVWSGEIARTRSYCSGLTPTGIAPAAASGDSYANDLAQQAAAAQRFFITVKGDVTSGALIDSARTMRPYATNADGIQSTAYKGQEVGGIDDTLKTTPSFSQMLAIDDQTCKRSTVLRVSPYPGGPPPAQPTPMPLQLAPACTNIVWDFTVAKAGAVSYSGFDYNFRCPTTSVGTGTCSISGRTCIVNSVNPCPAPPGPIGDVCTPSCSALGAIFRSSPVVVGPPNAFFRDDGYQTFVDLRKTRRPTMFVATTDGVLHGLKAIETGAVGAANQGGSAPGSSPLYEFFAFVPPAVLPRLATNFPSGQQILLDGTPAVKDVVWQRDTTSQTSAQAKNDWHTTLVAGFGAAGGGYYALNVSDADCGGNGNASECNGAGWAQPTEGNLLTAATGADTTGGRAPGPHFLWQLTDIEKVGTESAKPTRTSADGVKFVALFGKQTYTPAIATLQMRNAGVPVQVGVAILPGGMDAPPAKVNGSCTPGTDCCQRATKGGYGGGTFNVGFDISPTTGNNFSARNNVRKWSPTGCGVTDPVPGRGVTIVRLDTGEILRHFGRKNSADVPSKVQPVTTDSPFDSPIVGTPVVYPSAVGVPAQKIFVGDADGTVWRIDVSKICDLTSMSSCSDPATGDWEATLFQDLPSKGMSSAATPSAGQSTPVSLPIIVSQAAAGTLVVNAATGEQENIVSSTEDNYVVSVEETRPDLTNPRGKSVVHWFERLGNGERVTGPMVLFDRSLYFATYRPEAVGAICAGGAKEFLWGLDYLNTAGAGPPSSGGDCRWVHFAAGGADLAGPGCLAGLVPGQDVTSLVGNNLIPGVTVQPSLACSSFGASDQFSTGLSGLTPTTYSIVAGVGNANVGGGGLPTNNAQSIKVDRPSPRIAATLDAWAFITD